MRSERSFVLLLSEVVYDYSSIVISTYEFIVSSDVKVKPLIAVVAQSLVSQTDQRFSWISNVPLINLIIFTCPNKQVFSIIGEFNLCETLGSELTKRVENFGEVSLVYKKDIRAKRTNSNKIWICLGVINARNRLFHSFSWATFILKFDF